LLSRHEKVGNASAYFQNQEDRHKEILFVSNSLRLNPKKQTMFVQVTGVPFCTGVQFPPSPPILAQETGRNRFFVCQNSAETEEDNRPAPQ